MHKYIYYTKNKILIWNRAVVRLKRTVYGSVRLFPTIWNQHRYTLSKVSESTTFCSISWIPKLHSISRSNKKSSLRRGAGGKGVLWNAPSSLSGFKYTLHCNLIATRMIMLKNCVKSPHNFLMDEKKNDFSHSNFA